ncbi:hypothetical protein MMC21_006278 [Puttea exsequens]|nr:hypothetical protein [Puttea exsequens]
MTNGFEVSIAHTLGKALEVASSNNLELPITDMDLLSPHDKDQIQLWNHERPSSVHACIHSLFRQQAETCPSSPAVVAWDGSLSYAELDITTNTLAKHLHALGVRSGSIVPLCFEKSMWMTVAMISVLKAGGAVVPLDASYPKGRLLAIIRDVGAQIMITAPQFRESFVDHVTTIITEIRDLTERLSDEDCPISAFVQPNDSAFVLFTSGSTGKPKGLIHSHSSICSSAAAYAPALNLTAESRVLQFSAYSFDISVIDTIATLLHGGCLCVPSEHERLNDITGYIQRSRANWAFLTPSFARRIKPEEVPSLTDLVLGGEDVPLDSVRAWATEERRIFNGYGPAECAICITEMLRSTERPRIGKAVGCRTWVAEISNYSFLAPLGCVGELLVEGPVVFKGYIGEEAKKEAVFLDNPPWSLSSAGEDRRFYKTGDLVRYDPDGALVYHGRRDTQAKLRGQRIELGDVEHHIRSQLPQNTEVAAEIFNTALGVPSLAAFISTNGPIEDSQTFSGIRKELEGALPVYMIPSVFIPLPKLPINQSSKLDRRRLRVIASEFAADQFASLETDLSKDKRRLTDIEQKMARIWVDVLNNKSNFAVSDNFFAVGGDSLAAITLVSRARQQRLYITVAQIFQNPSLHGMAQTVSVLETKSNNVSPFQLLPQGIFDAASRQCRVTADAVEDIYPCTPMQEGLFALSLANPGTYVAQIVYEIPSHIRSDALKEAWTAVVKQYAILRTRIVGMGSKHYQAVTRSSLISWRRGRDLNEYLASDKQTTIEYGQPLLRMAIIESENSKSFVLTLHHAIFDGWALELMWKQVEEAYWGGSLAPVAQFSSFVRYLNIDATFSEQAQDFWHTLLEGATPASWPALPSATYRPCANASLAHSFSLPKLHTGITLSIAIRAAWAMLLAQYCNSKDVTFGMTLSGRFAPFEGIEDLIGPTIATVPVRLRINSTSSVGVFLEDVQRHSAEMIPYEQIGLQEIAKASADAHDACNFSSLLVVHPAEDVTTRTSKKIYHKQTVTNISLPHSLVVECHLTSDGATITTSYDSAILDVGVIRRVLNQLEHILRQLCYAGKEANVAEIQLTSPADMHDILMWNRRVPPAEDACIHEQIKVSAHLHPSAEAVCAWDGTLTYHELDELSSRLALRFINLGIGPEVIVPLCFDKSKWVVVSLVATLKAGGACLFLEPTWPRQRIQFILDCVRATVVVAEPQYLIQFDGVVPSLISVPSILDDAPGSISTPERVHSSNAAFVMFTSGTSGTPKGMVQTHTALITSARNHASMCNITSESRVLQFSAFTFDVYIIEICTTLISGGVICIPKEFDRMNNLTQVMAQMRVNWAFFTPTFCRSMKPEQMPHLRTLLVGGEAVDEVTIKKWVDHVLLLNCYGPAECGPSAMCKITPNHRPESIGSPLCVVCWIADPDHHDKLAPIGAIGELLLEGYTMARGYLDDPLKTKASFIAAPKWLHRLGPSRGHRLYKTGDLVRYAVDGTLDFIGRKDTQVKVRGQRVELGEVEHHLRRCLPGTVDAAAEMVKPSNSQGRASLIAFICLKDSQMRTKPVLLNESMDGYQNMSHLTANLWRQVESSVPSSMVPAALLFLTNMPINASGKLDRNRLKTLANEAPMNTYIWPRVARDTMRAPETDKEREMQTLWEKLLILDRPITADSDFFHLGADSITAMSLVTSARLAGFSLSVEQIFKNPVLSAMALQLHVCDNGGEAKDIAPFELLPKAFSSEIREEIAASCNVDEPLIEDVYPCTPLQEGLMALSLTHPGTYVSQNIYKLPHSLDFDRFKAAWNMAVRWHPTLRTRVLQTVHGPFQAVIGGPISWSVASEYQTYIENDRQNTMCKGEPMARLALFPEASDDEGRFILTLHHSIYDSWSMDLIWKTVVDGYSGLSIATSPSFNRFIKHLQASTGDAHGAYWRTQLSGADQTAFPKNGAGLRPLATSFITHTQHCPLRARPSSGITLPTLIRSAWALITARYSSTDDVTFGAVSNGRTAPVGEIDRLAAPVITTVPIRICLDRKLSLSTFLEQVQAQASDMIPFEHDGLQNIKQYLDYDDQHVCDVQTLLVIQPATNQSEPFPGVNCLLGGADFQVPHALVLICSLNCEGVKLQANFDPVLLKPESVRRIMAQLVQTLVELSHADPTTKIEDIDLVSIEDKLRICQNNVNVPHTVRQCVHDVIHQRAMESPKSIALYSWDGEMTYERLDYLSTRLASYIQMQGVSDGTTVPLLFEKSMWTVVALLAVMKAGGAVVLVDQSTTVASMEAIFRAVDAHLVLCSQGCKARLEPFPQLALMEVNAEISRYQTVPANYALAPVRPDSVAYINFTSGTTSSIPKAAVIEHSAYISGAIEHAKAAGIDNTSRVLQFASYNFDGAFLEILTPLLQGAVVAIPSEHDRFNNIADFINKAEVTLAILTPTVARAAIVPGILNTLRALVLVGEPMSRDDVVRFKAPGFRLVNGYGLTETCVCCSLLDVTEDNLGSIGGPIACNFWVTEPENHDRLAPLGTAGELLIEGPALAREYLKDESRTAAHFINDPAWSTDIRSMRLYKTGDLVRHNTDGTLTLAGRKDMQVKLRGQRIDLPEAELLVKQGLGEKSLEVACDLISPSNEPENMILAAFICEKTFVRARDEKSPLQITASTRSPLIATIRGLKPHTLGDVPSHMIPKIFIPVDRVPLLASGKVDRRRLTELAKTLTSDQLAEMLSYSKAERVKPLPGIERKLAGVWARVLSIQKNVIGADDSFFLWGDSISAIKLTAALREDGLDLPASEVIRSPVLSDMAKLVKDSGQEAVRAPPPPFALMKGLTEELLDELASRCAVLREDIEDIYPCTALQEGLMALSIKEKDSYIAQNVLKLPKSVDTNKFLLAWEAAIDSYPILRTRIVQTESKQSMQVVLSKRVACSRSHDLETYLMEDAQLSAGFGDPLNRFGLVTGSEHNYFIWTSHHATYDGWSVNMVFQQVDRLYHGIQADKLVPFNSYIAYLVSLDNVAADAFWRSQAAKENPIAFPSPPSRSYKPLAQTSICHRADLPQGNGSLSASIYAAWGILSSRYIDAKATVFGIVLNGRTAAAPGIEKVLGPTINTVPLRIDVDGDLSISKLTRAITEFTSGVVPFAHAGLQNIRKLNPEAATLCAFQSILVIQPDSAVELPCGSSLFSNDRQSLSNFNNYGLMLEFKLGARNLSITANFDNTLLDERLMRRILRQLHQLIQRIETCQPSTKISNLDILTAEDVDELKQKNMETPMTVPTRIEDLFQVQVQSRGNEPAIQSWDGFMTYQQLEVVSSSLAQHLSTTIKIQRWDVVPLCFERSIWTVVTLLAVLKVGGAVLLLDPAHPLDRLRTIVAETGAKIVLCDTKFSTQLHAHRVIELNAEVIQNLPHSTRLTAIRDTEDVAFIMSTSGSTGLPKLFKHTHQGICSAIMAYGSAMRLDSQSRIMQFAAYSFDICINEMLSALFYGGTLCLPSEHDRLNNTAGFIRQSQVNWLFAVPSFIRHAKILPEHVPSLRTLVLGGEALTQDIIDTWTGHVALVASYGPAECQICTVGPFEEPRDIGFANGCMCWIVDPEDVDRLMPHGMVGELIVQGPIISSGYLNASNSAFNVKPSWLPQHERTDWGIYRTGDLVKYNCRGSMTYLGRKGDEQLKLRGQRLEVGDIEYHLRKQLPKNLDVAVGVVERAGRASLVTFISSPDANVSKTARMLAAMAQEVQDSVAEALPKYMVPEGFVILDSIPLTVSGKTDRKRLRGVEVDTKNIITGELAQNNAPLPLSEKERLLQSLWSQVLELEIDKILANSDFFGVGGDSILAIRLVSIARAKDVHLSVAVIFENSKLREMAAASAVPEIDEDPAPFSLLDEGIELVIAEAAGQCKVQPSQVEDIYPCTPLQEGLFALSQRGGAYMARTVFSLPPALDLVAFKAAWESTAAMNPVLRTAIVQGPSRRLLQAVLKSSIEWTVPSHLCAFMGKDLNIGLGEPLTQFALSDDKYFVLTQHHAAYDGYSLPQIFHQVEQNYQRTVSDFTPAPYNRFVNYLKRANGKAAQEFWTRELSGSSATHFPSTPPGYQPKPSSYLRQQIKLESWDAVVTPSTLIRAAWALVVSAYSGHQDVTFGITLSGRQASVRDIERITGPTITTLPARVNVNMDLQVDQFLQALQKKAVEAIPFEQFGLQNIKKQISAEEKATCNFQNLLIIHPTPRDHQPNASIHIPVSDVPNHRNSTFRTYALNLECTILNKDAIAAEAFFDSDLIDEEHMKRILRQFQHILSQLRTSRHLRDIDLVNPQDQLEIMAWNSSSTLTKPAECIHRLIGLHLSTQFDSPAVCSWDGNLSYLELDQLSSRLAHHLISLGVRPEVNVPLCFEKSLWTVVAILSVMKSGGCFVPLDPSHPKSRLARIIEQAQAPLVLTSTLHASWFPNAFEVSESAIGQLASPPAETFNSPDVQPSNSIYMMFTSGSSGQPKGVVIEHQAFSSGSKYRRHLLQLGPSSRVLQFSSYSFDVSMEDILSTLIAGGTVCIPSEEERLNDLARAMRQLKVNAANLTPSVANLIDPEDVPNLKVLALGGEPMTETNVWRWADRVRLINFYGPTECSVTVSVNTNIAPQSNPKNIGRAVGCTSWVSAPEDHDRLVPVGAPGELLIEGPILARGYHQDDKKTRAAFIENPRWADSPKRLYKTGDLVCYGSDGSLIYLGRVEDTQIKIRGQRVELGEVEYHLRSLLPVTQNIAADLLQQETKPPVLAAFLDSSVIEHEGNEKAEYLISQMLDKLPAHMIPSVFIPIKKLPLSSSGKVDRRALCQLGLAAIAAGKAIFSETTPVKTQKPSTDLERQMQLVWSEILNIPTSEIGADSPFLSLGGDSISAIQVVGRCRSREIAVSTFDILQHKTIAKICIEVEKNWTSVELVKGRELDTDEFFGLSPIQREFFLLMPDGNNAFQQSFLVKLKRKYPSEEIGRAFHSIVSSHGMLRARYSRTENHDWKQRIANQSSLNYYFQSYDSSDTDNILQETNGTIDISKGPVFAVALINTRSEQLLYLTAHHLVIDLVSWRIILHEVEQILLNSTLGPSKEPLTFSTWCRLQADYICTQTAELQALIIDIPSADYEYWQIQDNGNIYEQAQWEHFKLDEDLSALLLGKCNDPLRTEPVEIFLAAIFHSFGSCFTDRGPPALFNEGHGREPWNDRLDLSSTVGWFTTMYPLIVENDTDIVEMVRHTKDARRNIPGNGWHFFTHHHLRDQNATPLEPEIVFNYLGQYQQLERKDALLQLMPIANPSFAHAGANVQRSSLFDVFVVVQDRQIRFDFGFNRHIAQQDRIRQWIQQCQLSLKQAASRLSSMERQYTLSDFPLVPQNFRDFSALRTQIIPSLPAKASDIYPCSPMQRKMFQSQLSGSGCYEAFSTWRMTPIQGRQVDVSRLEKAWQLVVNRNDLLRTCVMEVNEVALQIVLEKYQAEMVLVNEKEKLGQATIFESLPLSSQAHRPMHRISLFQEATGAVICKFEIHHALIDGASIAILLRQLAYAYAPLSQSMQPVSTYRDYVRFLQTNQRQSTIKYWKEYTKDGSFCLFPSDSTLYKTELYSGPGSVSVDLSAMQSALHPFCKQHGLTLSTLFNTIWTLVLHLHTHQDDICFGYLVSGRDIPVAGVARCIGPFFNLLCCRLQVQDSMTLLDVLQIAQADAVESVRHQNCSLPEVLDDTAREPFNTLVNFRKYAPMGQEQASGIAFEALDGYDPFDYDIVVGIAEHKHKASVVLTYWGSRISDALARRVADDFRKMLELILQHPRSTVADLV